MEGSARDSEQDWLPSGPDRPPTLAELVGRIDEALAVARAAEAAVAAVGNAAIDASEQARAAVEQALRAAEQAHRSAALAMQASTAMLEGRSRQPSAGAGVAAGEDQSLRSFSERADRVVARLRALERLPA